MAASVTIDDDLEDRVWRLAGLKKTLAGLIMREAIAQYVAREEAREDFSREALDR